MSDNNITVKLRNVRLSFPALFEARAMDGGTPKFSAAFLLNKKSDAAQIKSLEEAINSLLKTKNKGGKLPPNKVCLRDGSEKDFDGYGDEVMYVSASNARRPLVVDLQGNPLVTTDGKPYAGCYVNANIDVWWQDNKYGKRVNASLRSVQFVKDGESFGAGPLDAAKEFEDVTADEDVM
jgi:hypothetical protein